MYVIQDLYFDCSELAIFYCDLYFTVEWLSIKCVYSFRFLFLIIIFLSWFDDSPWHIFSRYWPTCTRYLQSDNYISPWLTLTRHWQSDTYVSSVLGCGGNFTGSSGVITSPNYPSNYPPDVNCTYRIFVTEGRHIRLNFTSFNTESFSDELFVSCLKHQY